MALHLTNTDNVTDDATLNLDDAAGVATAVVGGTTYLFVPGPLDNGVSVFCGRARRHPDQRRQRERRRRRWSSCKRPA